MIDVCSFLQLVTANIGGGMESGMESKYKEVVFHESGWYDCCSSSWNISYSLYDTDDNQVKTLYSVDECKMFAFAYGLQIGRASCRERV